MMNYEIFREVVAEKFKDFLPKEYEGLDVIVNPTKKVNQELDGLTLSGDGIRVAPTIYINLILRIFFAFIRVGTV